jgi:hypothetical protein
VRGLVGLHITSWGWQRKSSVNRYLRLEGAGGHFTLLALLAEAVLSAASCSPFGWQKSPLGSVHGAYLVSASPPAC